MNISGIYIKAWPAELSVVEERLAAVPGVEVHMSTVDGGMVVTVETEDVATMAETVTKLQEVDGVLSATLVYHHDEQSLSMPPSTSFTAVGGVQ